MNDTCMAITNDMINLWVEDQFKGFKTVCIENWNISVINGLDPIQTTWFQPEQCMNFTSYLVMQITPQVLSQFMISQIANFPSKVISQFTVPQLGKLYLIYTTSLLTGLPRSAFYLTPSDNILSFKNNITQNQFPQLLNHSDPALNDPMSYNWLIVTAIKDTEIALLLAFNNFTYIQNIRPDAIAGLRSGQVGNLTNFEVFSNINGSQASYLYPDVLANMNIDQYKSLTPAAFGGINPLYINSIPQDVYSQLSCPQIQAFTDDQKNIINTNENFRKQFVLCTFGLYSEEALLTGFGIACACAIILTIVGLYVIRRKNQFDYVALHNNN